MCPARGSPGSAPRSESCRAGRWRNRAPLHGREHRSSLLVQVTRTNNRVSSRVVIEAGDIQVHRLRGAAQRLIELAAATEWRGPDPYDGLFVRWPALLVGGRRRRPTIFQLHARSPVDIRPLYRRRHSLVPKAPALLGQAASRLVAAREDDHLRELAHDALQTLVADTTCGEDGWGYPWDTQTRWSYYPGGSPNVVATAFSANALAEAAVTLD